MSTTVLYSLIQPLNNAHAICHKCFCHSAHHSLVNEVKFVQNGYSANGNGKKEIYRIDALTARQNCNRNEFNSTKYFEFFCWSSLPVSHSNVLIGPFPIFRNTCVCCCLYGVISRYLMRSYHLHEHFYDLEMTLPATVCECVRWLSSIWNDHHQPTNRAATEPLAKQFKSHICVCEMHIYGTQSHIESVPIYANVIAR